jgi:hypothetical protein
MSEVSHWYCCGWCGMKTVSWPEPNSTPEAAMDLLLEKALRGHRPTIRGMRCDKRPILQQ